MASCDAPKNKQPAEEEDLVDVSESEDELQSPNCGNKGKRKETGGGSGLGSRKKTRSWVWEHLTRFEDNYDRCKCRYCPKEMSCSTTSETSNLKKHLLACKQFAAWEAAKKNKNQTVLNAGEDGNMCLAKVSEDIFHKATNEMIVLAELPLAFIESLAWRHFCSRVNLYKPKCRKTCTKEIVEMFVARKTEMKKILGKNKQRLSLTTDIWVAPYTGSSYMVITAHFIDASWSLKKMIIGFKNVTDHKGETIANVLLECLAEWDIKRVFCITVDNATANTNALRLFKERFKELHGDEALVLKGDYLHIRCATHILNLIVKEGLMEVDESLSAIRNGITYVRSSTNRLKSFEFRVETGKITRGSLPLDVSTRWNSTYLMLDQALKFKVAFEKMEAEDKPYNDYFMEYVNGKRRFGPPISSDWEAVDRLVQFLVIFYNSTLILSASTSITSHKIYNEIVTITRNISKLTSAPGPDEELRTKAIIMMGKLRKYWNPLWDGSENDSSQTRVMNKLLIVASVFDPRKKMQFAKLCFEKLYGKDSLEFGLLSESISDILKSLYEEYSGFACNSGSGGSASSSQSQDQVRAAVYETMVFGNGVGYERMDNLYEELIQETASQDSTNELEVYLKENVETSKGMLGSDYDVLSWWRKNSAKFPVLSQVARDILAIQVSSVASESAFSTSGRVLDPHRSCLTHYMIEVLMCTEQWLKCEIRMNERGVFTIQQMLSDIELQDDLMRKHDPDFNSLGQGGQ